MALTDNIIHYYKFDESSGDAGDSVGSLTLSNHAAYATGKIGNAASIATGSNYFNTASNIFASQPSGYTFSFWFKPSSVPGSDPTNNYIMLNENPGRVYIMYNSNNAESIANPHFTIKHWDSGSNQITVTYTTTLSTSSWYHVAVTWDGSNIRLYLNNSLVGGPTAATSIIWTYSTYGYYIGYTTIGIEGLVDEVGIWSRALSAAEVTSLYNSGNGLQYPFVTTSISKVAGVAYASISKVNGVAKASIAKVAGLA